MQSYSSRNNHHITRIINRVGTKLTLFLLALLLGSCATLSHYQGIGRIRRYTLCDNRLPREFDSTTIAFVTDTHYPSKFTRKRLKNTVRAIGDLSPHLLLLGGDYVTSLAHAEELFAALGNSPTHYGRYAVLGNHDRAIADTLSSIMHRNGITMLAEESDTLRNNGAEIYICGIEEYNATNNHEWVQQHADSAFTIVVVHTPDYAQNTSIENVSAVFSGHTHGGQVTLLGLYAPVTHSRYGKRFLSGLNHTDNGTPVITSNGLGTSRKKIRFCAPSDIIFVTLRKE